MKHNRYSWLNLFNSLYWVVLFNLAYARILLKTDSFENIARRMNSRVKQKEEVLLKEKPNTDVIKISQVVKSLSKKVPFRALCFEQALALQMLLKKKGLNSSITFGIKTEQNHLAAHAWLNYQGATLIGNKGKEHFATLIEFGEND